MTDEIKLPLTSADVTDALLVQLRAASPQIFSEGRVDFAKLQAALGEHIDTNPERYGLTWAGKRDAFRNVQVPSVATLRPQPEESVNWDSSENLIIEGDNLEVLKLLQKPYHGKVKMIYIDPPYNTGNEFIYPDNFREGLDEYLRYTGQLGEDGTATSTNKDTSGRYHSNWLNMMYPRLFLARNLLKEDGVIFVSINDCEVHNLACLMNEIFGEENHVANLIWDKGHSAQAGVFKIYHEYVLVYARSAEMVGVPTSANNDCFEAGAMKREEARHPLQDFDFPAGVRFEAPNGTEFKGQWGGAEKVEVVKGRFVAEGGMTKFPVTLRAAFTQRNQMQQYFYGDRASLVDSRGQKVVEFFFNSTGKVKVIKERGVFTPDTTLEYGTQSAASTELAELFGLDESPLDNPKPPKMLADFVSWFSQPDEIVLDFFAGSGTTAHAVLDLNHRDGGNRKFILVQLPEKTDNPQYPTIAHITRERVRRVIGKLQESRHSRAGGNPAIQNALDLNPLDSRLRGNDEEGRGNDGDLGFRAFKLDSSNFKIWRSDNVPQSAEQLAEQLKLYADNVQIERSDQDRLYELILKSGRPLSARVEEISLPVRPEPVEGQVVHASTNSARTAIYSVGDGDLLICLEPHLDRDTLRALFARKPQMVLCLDTAFDGNDALKTNTVLEAQSHGIVFKTA